MSKTETTSDAEITITTPFGASAADVPEVAKLDAGTTTPPAVTQMVDAIAARIAAEDHPFTNVARAKDPTPEEVAAMERELAENAEREAAAEPVLRVDNVTPNMDMTISLPKLAAAIDALGKFRATVADEPEVAAAVERAGEQDTKDEVLAGLRAARGLSTRADTVATIAEFEEHYAAVVGA